jgi:exopolysaccharide biosynthesis polyprenyl glycosylphosphotransferase
MQNRAFVISRPPSWQRGMKRALDLVVSGIALLVLSPLLAVIALAVKLTSPGPALYRWNVVGQQGRFFEGYKFRTMVVDADQLKSQLLTQNEMQGPVFKIKNDPRITPVGRILRKFSLDELPQLWSVFKGDMSLVGPRPPLQSEYAHFTEYQKQKLAVKPGITCLWQISGRNEIRDFEEWVRLDLEYIRTWSLWLDFKILWRTLFVVLRGTGR